MPNLSITIVSPMPGAVVTPSCPVSGTLVNTLRRKEGEEDRNYSLRTATQITVTVTKGGTSYGSFLATQIGNQWSASTATLIPAGTGYTVTASITDGTDVSSNSVETVDVQSAPPMQMTLITPPPGFKLVDETSLVKKAYDIEGKHEPEGADEVFAFPYTIRRAESNTNLPTGGKHYHVTYQFEGPVVPEYKQGEIKPGKKWKITGIKVEPHQFVMVFLKQNGDVIASNSSRLF